MMVEGRRCGNGSVNSKLAHPLVPGICWALVILLVPAVGNLSENLCPGRVAFVNSSRSD